MNDISYPFAFFAGILSFLSPCVLPLIPSYISFITGISFEDLREGIDRKRIKFLTITNSLAFISGFSTIFIILGISSSAIGNLLFKYIDIIRILGAILIIIFGLFIAGFLKIDLLMKDKKIRFKGKPSGYIGSFFVGMTFAAGWSPCIGPVLGTIIVYAGSKGSMIYGLKLLSVYSIGLSIPFFLSSIAINSFLIYSKKVMKYMKTIMILSGLFLVLFGLLLLTDMLKYISGLITIV